MKKVASLCLLFVIVVTSSFSQSKTRRLPSSINHPALKLNYTSRENDWTPPAAIPKTINHRITFLRGYSLSADGKRMYYSSAKSPTIGGYDIFTSELKGTVWADPQNILLP